MGRRVDGTRVQGAGRKPSTLRRRLPRRPPRRPASQKRAPPTRPRRDQRRAPRDHHRFQRRAPRARSCRCTRTSSRRRCPSSRAASCTAQRARHSAQRAADVRVEHAQLRIRRRFAHTQPHPSLSSPVMPAAGSACPMFALMPPITSALLTSRQNRRTSDPPRSGRRAPCPCRAPRERQTRSTAASHLATRRRASPAAPGRWEPSGSHSARPDAPRSQAS